MLCKNCWCEIEEDSNFCSQCGMQVEGSEKNSNETWGILTHSLNKMAKQTFKRMAEGGKEIMEDTEHILFEKTKTALNKKTGKVTDKALKRMGLKKKTPLDIIKNMKK